MREKRDKKRNKNLCIIQARMGSTRLPKKVLLRVNDIPLLEYEIKRVKLAKKIDKIVVATTTEKEDGKIEALCKKLRINCFRGPEKDVLGRFYQCSLQYPQYENIVRITGDCPLIDPAVIDHVITVFEKSNYDFVSNVEKPTFPDGIDVEVFKQEVLLRSAQKAKLPSEREHVTLYMRKDKKIKKFNVENQYDFSHFRLSVDYKEDFEVVKFLIRHSKITDGYLHYISLLTKNPKMMLNNLRIVRNEGLLKSLKEDLKFFKK